ncbi:MAG: class II aldolase/adducin family protein [Candidatus Eremiobacteraeota bacterium]|nr:class II aldolase/adducin family protein [Candidatus Eremiobacteraeota bacterium]
MNEYQGKIDEDVIKLIVEKVVSNCPGKTIGELSPLIGRVISRLLNKRSLEEKRKDIVKVGKHFYCQGFLAGTSGNISVRVGENALLITPSGINKGIMVPEDILLVDLQGNLLEQSHHKPSSEMKMHLVSYMERPDVSAIVHAHPPFSMGFATARLPLDMPVLPEAILVLGDIPLVEYGTPSTREVSDNLRPYLKGHNAFLLESHGSLTFGANLDKAAHRMETLELYAKVILIARMLGGEKLLSDGDLRRLKRTFECK